MKIKEILDEIRSTGGTTDKMNVLRKYVDNDTLKEVLYLTYSPRVKFYIKQIPEYTNLGFNDETGYTMEHIVAKVSAFTEGEVTGGSATKYLKALLTHSDQEDADVLELMIGKSAKINLGTTNINKIFPNLIEKTPYQGAKPFSEDLARKLFNGKAVRSDIKMDGRYANAIIRDGEVELVSRQGEITHVGNARFLQELTLFPDGVLNGELTIDGVESRLIANGIVASIVDIEGRGRKGDRSDIETDKKKIAFAKKHGSYEKAINNIRFTVWDRITISDYFDSKSVIPYESRRKDLVKLLDILPVSMVTMVESKLIYTYAEAIKHFQEALSRGLEGTIIKAMDGAWKNGKPTWQIKMKLEINLDLRITGFNYGTKGSKNEFIISSINTESDEGLLKTSPAGISEDMMQYITDNQDTLLNTVVEVKCCGLSQNSSGAYSTLHPVFIKLRDDKNEVNTLNECIQIDESSKSLT